jgi:hypothetical protein
VISSNSSAEQTGEDMPEVVAPDPAPRPVRRTFTAAYRLSIGNRDGSVYKALGHVAMHAATVEPPVTPSEMRFAPVVAGSALAHDVLPAMLVPCYGLTIWKVTTSNHIVVAAMTPIGRREVIGEERGWTESGISPGGRGHIRLRCASRSSCKQSSNSWKM